MSIANRNIILNTFFILTSFMAVGQDKGGPPPPSRTIDPPFGDPLPIDESIIYLCIAGILLGIYFYMNSKNVRSN